MTIRVSFEFATASEAADFLAVATFKSQPESKAKGKAEQASSAARADVTAGLPQASVGAILGPAASTEQVVAPAAPAPEPEQPAAPAPEQPAAPEAMQEMLVDTFTKLGTIVGIDAVKAIMAKYQAQSVVSIPQEHWAAAIDEASAQLPGVNS